MTIVQDAMNASMPGTAKQFLGSVQAKPIGQMVMYVAMISLLPLIGYILGWMIGWGSAAGIQWGIIYSVVMFIGTIVAVIGSGLVLGIMSHGLLGRQVSNNEAVTLVGYAATPGIAIGLLAGLLAFIWGLGFLGMLLAFLGWIYSAYLLYIGAGVRYGADKAVAATIVVVIAEIVISFIFSAIAGAIVWNAIWSAAWGNALNYGGYRIPAGYNYYNY